jgi:hypothetical protein
MMEELREVEVVAWHGGMVTVPIVADIFVLLP